LESHLRKIKREITSNNKTRNTFRDHVLTKTNIREEKDFIEEVIKTITEAVAIRIITITKTKEASSMTREGES